MAALPSKFVPLIDGLKTKQGIRKKRIQFGDGYSQVTVNSVNSEEVNLTARYFFKNDQELQEFKAFFVALGAAPLDFTLPDETVAGKYEVVDLKEINYQNSRYRQAVLKLKKIYGGNFADTGVIVPSQCPDFGYILPEDCPSTSGETSDRDIWFYYSPI